MSLDLNVNELWRLAGVLDVFVIIACLAYLHMGYRNQMPPVLYRVGWAFGFVMALVALSLTANWLSPYPPTPGSKIFAVGATGAALYAAAETWRSVRS